MKLRMTSVMLVLLGAGLAQAATNVWDGGASPDGNWSADNWLGVAPANSFSNDFAFGGAANVNTTNDLTGGTAASITFSTGDAFSLNGNGLKLAGDILNASGSVPNINLDMELAAGVRDFNVGNGNNMAINGTLSGTGFLRKELVGILTLTGDNTYSGGTKINGTVQAGSDTALGTGDVELRGTLRGNDGTRRTLANNLVIGTTSVTFGNYGNKLTFNGDVDLGSSDRTWTVLNAVNNGNFRQIMSGVISGTGALIKAGNGGLDLNNAGNTFSGGVTLVDGYLYPTQDNCLGSGPLTFLGGVISTVGFQTRVITNAVSVEADFGMAVVVSDKSLFLNGGMDLNGASRTITLTEPGTKYLNGAIANGGLVLAAAAADTGNITLGGANTYTGDTTVGSNVVLTLADDAALTFAMGANGVNNQLDGTGTNVLDGDFVFDVSGADTTPGNEWQIIDPALLANTTFSGSFTVSGFVDEGDGLWTKSIDTAASYSFSEETAVLSVLATAPPEIGNVGYEFLPGGNSVSLSWTAASGFSYTVQTNSDLIDGVWGDFQTGITGGGVVLITNDLTGAVGFYRIVAE